MQDIKTAGVKGDGIADDTETINQAIKEMSKLGGGILRFTAGTYNVRTVHLLAMSGYIWMQMLPFRGFRVVMRRKQLGLVTGLTVRDFLLPILALC